MSTHDFVPEFRAPERCCARGAVAQPYPKSHGWLWVHAGPVADALVTDLTNIDGFLSNV